MKPEHRDEAAYTPLISVITPCRNAARYIARAIDSVLEQDYENVEHVVVDGDSTDGTRDILAAYGHLDWISEPDAGQVDAMNKGFARSRGDIIVYLNGDDYFLPGAFKSVLPYFARGEKFVVGNVLNVHEGGAEKVLAPRTTTREMVYLWRGEAFPYNPVQYFYRREVQEAIPFNPDNNWSMDHEFLLEASTRYPFCKIDHVLGVYSSISGAKTVEGQKDPFSYWTVDNFAYIDRYIADWPVKDVLDFKNEQMAFYARRYRQAFDAGLQQEPDSGILQAARHLYRTSLRRHPLKKYRLYRELGRLVTGNRD